MSQRILIKTKKSSYGWNGVTKVVPFYRGFWDGDWQKREFPDLKEDETVTDFSIDGEKFGIRYNEELASSAGISVLMFIPETATDEDIQNFKSEMSFERDVVRYYESRV